MRTMPAFTALVLGLGLAAAGAQAAESVRIGAPFHLTGELSSLDGPALAGARLKAKEINAAGGVLGRPIELVVLDVPVTGPAAAGAAEDLLGHDRVKAAIGFTDTDSVLALGPVFQRAGVPFVTPGATSPKLPDQIGDTMFLACFGDNVQAAAGAEFVRSKLSAATAFLLKDSSTEYTNLLARYFEEAFAAGGGRLVGRGEYRGGDTSFADAIAAIKAAQPAPEVLYVSAMPDDIGLVVKSLRAAGVAQPIVGGDGYDTPLLAKIAGKAADDVYFSTHAYMAPDSTPAIKEFYQAYRAAYGHDPENAFAALGYDAMGLVADAIRRAGSDDPKAIRDALAATQGYAGITGTISYPAGSRVPAKTVTMIAIRDGKPGLGAAIDPGHIPPP